MTAKTTTPIYAYIVSPLHIAATIFNAGVLHLLFIAVDAYYGFTAPSLTAILGLVFWVYIAYTILETVKGFALPLFTGKLGYNFDKAASEKLQYSYFVFVNVDDSDVVPIDLEDNNHE